MSLASSPPLNKKVPKYRGLAPKSQVGAGLPNPLGLWENYPPHKYHSTLTNISESLLSTNFYNFPLLKKPKTFR